MCCIRNFFGEILHVSMYGICFLAVIWHGYNINNILLSLPRKFSCPFLCRKLPSRAWTATLSRFVDHTPHTHTHTHTHTLSLSLSLSLSVSLSLSHTHSLSLYLSLSLSHTHTLTLTLRQKKSVELLWARDHNLAETWQHKTFTRDRHPVLPAGLEPTTIASEWPLDRAPICLGIWEINVMKIILNYSKITEI